MFIKGKITKKNVKTGTTNSKDWQLYLYTVDKKIFATLAEDYANFKEGEDVTIEYDKGDKGFNVIAMERLSEPSKQASIHEASKTKDNETRIAEALERIAAALEILVQMRK